MRVPLRWLQEMIPFSLSVAELCHRLTMAGIEVESIEQVHQDTVLTLGITPNRGDCLSMMGIAREVAMLTGKAIRSQSKKKHVPGKGSLSDLLSVEIKAKKECLRYCARIVKGLRVSPSPDWLKERLEACGLRSLNNVVDATNYVMWECGQPLHAFDLTKIKGKHIVVRTAGKAVTLTSLDGVERHLIPSDLVIADGESPLALAGIMGGSHSEISSDTTDILLESACFEPQGIRRTSKRLGLISESSRRFERGVDPNGVAIALDRVTELLVELAGGVPTKDTFDVRTTTFQPKCISLATADVERLLGKSFSRTEIANTLKKIGLIPKQQKPHTTLFTVPTFRSDLTRPVDLVEELARVVGYGEIPESLPLLKLSRVRVPSHTGFIQKAKHCLWQLGFSETVLYGFTREQKDAPFEQEKPLLISNPLSEDHRVMRQSLISGLLDAIKNNLNHQETNLRLFALQRIYASRGDKVSEVLKLSGVMGGVRSPSAWQDAQQSCDFYDLKGVVESLMQCADTESSLTWELPSVCFFHPGESALVKRDGGNCGVMGRIHPDILRRWDMDTSWYAFELDVEAVAKTSTPHWYQEISRYPVVRRDMALIVDESVVFGEIVSKLNEVCPHLLTSAEIFDVYRGKHLPEGKKSMAFRLTFGLPDRTLTDEEVRSTFDALVKQVSLHFKASLRV